MAEAEGRVTLPRPPGCIVQAKHPRRGHAQERRTVHRGLSAVKSMGGQIIVHPFVCADSSSMAREFLGMTTEVALNPNHGIC